MPELEELLESVPPLTVSVAALIFATIVVVGSEFLNKMSSAVPT